MSSTNTSASAGTGHVRHKDDAYVTEARVTDALLRGVEEIMCPDDLDEGDYLGEKYGRPVLPVHPWASYSVVDAGSGAGSILGTLRERGLTRSTGVEYRDDLAAKCLERGPCVQASFFDVVQASMTEQPGCLERPNAVIMNPPYMLAMEFVEAALRWVRTTKSKATGEKKYATVAALLRLPWLASKGRVKFHQKNPSGIWVLPDRPSFTGDNKVDSTDYCWFVWSKDPAFPPNTWRVLDMAAKPKKIRVRGIEPVAETELGGAIEPGVPLEAHEAAEAIDDLTLRADHAEQVARDLRADIAGLEERIGEIAPEWKTS